MPAAVMVVYFKNSLYFHRKKLEEEARVAELKKSS